MKPGTAASRATACLAAAALALGTPNLRAGDLNSEMNSMFSALGGMGNYTAPGAFKGQAYGTFTGGSLYYRAPNRTYQLATIQWPQAKGGCGGIDLFGGSFSHISADEFKNMLRNITSALPGIAFQLAIDAVSPLLGGLTKWAKGLESMLTNGRVNSCEMATALVSSAAEATGYNTEVGCRSLARMFNVASDEADATQVCRTAKSSILNRARSDGDPAVQAKAPFIGNLTWAALKKIDTLDDRARELAMSMLGTYVYPDESVNGDPTYVGPTITTVAHLLRGQSDGAGGTVRVQLLRCRGGEYAQCLNVDRVDEEVEPLGRKVAALMQSIADAIASRSAIPNPSPEVGLVNNTSLPVWRMLSIGSIVPGSQISAVLINQYSEVVACDFAATFLAQFSGLALAALHKDSHLSEAQARKAQELRAEARAFVAAVQKEQADLYGRLASVSNVVADLERMERTLRASLPSQVVDMLGYSATR